MNSYVSDGHALDKSAELVISILWLREWGFWIYLWCVYVLCVDYACDN